MRAVGDEAHHGQRQFAWMEDVGMGNGTGGQKSGRNDLRPDYRGAVDVEKGFLAVHRTVVGLAAVGCPVEKGIIGAAGFGNRDGEGKGDGLHTSLTAEDRCRGDRRGTSPGVGRSGCGCQLMLPPAVAIRRTSVGDAGCGHLGIMQTVDDRPIGHEEVETAVRGGFKAEIRMGKLARLVAADEQEAVGGHHEEVAEAV